MVCRITLLFFLFSHVAYAISYELRGIIIRVSDGDTVSLFDNKQHRIRLYGIDAPEDEQAFGDESKQMLIDLIKGKEVTAECFEKDFFKRHICRIFYNSKDINAEMVSLGGAWVYRKYYKRRFGYLEREAQARNNKLGLWQDNDAIPPWQWRKQQKNK